MTVKAFAPAKINLTLHVTGQRSDGYHLLDSLVVFADVGDSVTLTPGPELSMDVVGELAAGVPADHRNLVWKAAKAVGWTGHIELEKALPHGGGVGGGSADAAAALTALSAQGVPIPQDVPLSLGADVPVCISAKSTRMQGIGDALTPVPLPHLPVVLVNPGVSVPTQSVFAALSARDNTPMPDVIPDLATPQVCAQWLRNQRNDLENPALQCAPEIAGVLDELEQTSSALLARMSGSGSTCFALYPTMKDAHLAAYDIGAAHPDWWCRATRLN
ncbi:4-diphosphocytidyl-2C-methyl-D-erythritol kinase [Ruegeria sp. ANG-S4]|uniref:4-(cytidine 5'-diphospho)-2-C-methyl-D-erythritol kinase n=1 Tax=Ruegeria sp. ANG-S4 TaxID=1577904 RepID=UPI00057DCAA2|nr:4-(cytidine 5'-diphospho)-2-C-methyl-D-erythritol kinase [Ruegeria sp. ANG-S4]KIC46505.1 4-diphosphocytidyl-2C-methyl-D-erythritol kinase [Ruegeria sp. ANG-S4]